MPPRHAFDRSGLGPEHEGNKKTAAVDRPHRRDSVDDQDRFAAIGDQSGELMKIARRFTEAGKSPYASIAFRRATSEIKNPDGSIVFRLEGFDVPEHWSQVAADILAQKYFRKAGVPRRLKKIEETQVPSWLWRSVADDKALAELPMKERIVGESDCRQVFDRLAGTWT